MNLFSNSIKFTEKGRVDIRCLLLKDHADKQFVQFIVTDTGIGMDESFMANLFQKFQQEDESVTRRFGGTGLGMSICKELIEFMGGNISVSSVKGEGTSVIFSLPFEKGSETDLPVKETGPLNSGILEGKRILVTDDNEMNRLVATTILKGYGAILDEANNGFDAIEKIKLTSYDIVLMDIQMPVMDGLEATRIIRNKISRDLPVIALTALALKGDEAKFREAGMTDYISKPFEEKKLIQVIAGCLGKKLILENISEVKDSVMVLYSLDKLEEIAKGDAVFVQKMISLFIEQGPVAVCEISEAFAKEEYLKMSQTAHRFKTSLYSIGVVSLTESMNQLEKFDPKNEEAVKLPDVIAKVEETVGRVIAELKKLSAA